MLNAFGGSKEQMSCCFQKCLDMAKSGKDGVQAYNECKIDPCRIIGDAI